MFTIVLGNITILPWSDDIKWHDNRYRRNFSIPKYRYHDIIVNIMILSPISQNCWSLQFKKFHSMFMMSVFMYCYNHFTSIVIFTITVIFQMTIIVGKKFQYRPSLFQTTVKDMWYMFFLESQKFSIIQVLNVTCKIWCTDCSIKYKVSITSKINIHQTF